MGVTAICLLCSDKYGGISSFMQRHFRQHNFMQRMWFWFYGLPNILGLLLLLLGLLLQLALMQTPAGGLPYWLPMCVLLYVLGWIVGWWRQDDNADLHFSQTLDIEATQEALKHMRRQVTGRIPDAAHEHLLNIEKLVLSILPQLMDTQLVSHDLYTVKQTVFDYLPTTLENYLRLPTAYATLHPINAGKTAKTLLIEQLTLIDDSLQQIQHNLFSDDSQALLANQRFLQQRLEQSPSLLDG